jgi:GMP synthase-like glutamine amidotransferase
VNVLAVVHHAKVGPGTFGECIRAKGHDLEVHGFPHGIPRRPLAEYGAILVCGGPMHAGDDARHPWLREEREFLRRVVESGTPVLGLCLGAQLIAKALSTPVFDAPESEIGWREVVMEPSAASDPICAGLPPRFHAFQWHYQANALPAGGTALARNRVGLQAYRVGDRAWGFQFHPEVTERRILEWMSHDEWERPAEATAIANETLHRIATWNRIGRSLCAAFLDAAGRSR